MKLTISCLLPCVTFGNKWLGGLNATDELLSTDDLADDQSILILNTYDGQPLKPLLMNFKGIP